MDENQRREAALYVAGCLDKLCVGCVIVGMFQPDHMFGGLIGGVLFFLAGLIIRVRATK